MSGPQIARLIGGAGTGKTTELLRIMEQVVERGVDPRDIGFVSFTRAARQEAAERAATKFGVPAADLLERGWFRTIHSVCYQALGRPDGLLSGDAASRDWLREHVSPHLSAPQDAGDALEHREADSPASAALSLWGVARNRLEPLTTVHAAAARRNPDTPPLAYCLTLARRYEEAKRLHGRCDFADLLASVAGLHLSPEHGATPIMPRGDLPALPVWFFDEQQDASALLDAVCRRLVAVDGVRWAYVVGDPFQCQPAGTMVRTAQHGDVPIERLDPQVHRLMTWDRPSQTIIGKAGEIGFRINSGRDRCRAVELANGMRSKATGNHRWVVKWIDKQAGKCCVYLMRKGNRWRVGWCQVFSSSNGDKAKGGFHFGVRCNIERADEGWILGVYDSRTEASIAESIVSAEYGIPTVMFRGSATGHYSQQSIDRIFDHFGDRLESRARQALGDFGRDINYPLWQSVKLSGESQQLARVCEIRTCNLIPGMMAVPVPKTGTRTTEWVTITDVGDYGEEEVVYGLDVDRHHTYIADGMVTHNSIYGFSGASSEHFLRWEVARERIMPQTHRCPAPVHTLGEACLRRCSDYWDRGIAAAAHEGSVASVHDVAELVDRITPDESWLLIARTHYLAAAYSRALDDAGLPWCGTQGTGGWSAPARSAGLLALCDLEEGAPVMPEAWWRVTQLLPSAVGGTTLLRRGTKTRFDDAAERARLTTEEALIMPETLGEYGASESLVELIASGRWTDLCEHAPAFRRAVRRWGAEIVQRPTIRVGTIHSVKGSEADNVGLLGSTTGRIAHARSMDRESADEERRVAYVGVTRARRNLYLVGDPANRRHRLDVPGV